MTRHAIFITLLLTIVGCRSDRTPEVIQLAADPAEKLEPQAQPATAEPPQKSIETPAASSPTDDAWLWSVEPPHDGVELGLLRTPTGQVSIVGDNFAIDLGVPKFGDCVEDLVDREPPEGLPEAAVTEDPAWLALRGEEGSASLRLSTTGAMLVIDDGCQRVARVTRALLGTKKRNKDAVFDAGPVAPEQAFDASGVELRRHGKTGARIVQDRDTLLEVKFFSGESTLTARELDGDRWFRLLMAREWEYSGNDGSIGREHILVWSLPRGEDKPMLVLDNDYRYGLDGTALEERDVTSSRVRTHPDGRLEARGVRRMVERAPNGSAGHCRATKSPLAFRGFDEEVNWTFTPTGKRRAIKLGTAKRRATFASGCLDDARKKAEGRRQRLIARAPDGKVRWKLP